jgi:hypothetical protein
MPEDLPHWLRGLSLPAKAGLYAALAISTFVLAVVVGGLAAVAMGGDLVSPGRNAPGPPGGRVEDTTLQGIASQYKSGADSQYAVPEGESRGSKEGASTERPLWEALQECEQSQEDCARDFVTRIAPAAEYVGGRIDTDDSGRNRHVLYFVDPARSPCEYVKFESPADASNVSYVVLIAGEGSFTRRQQEDIGAGCLPEL